MTAQASWVVAKEAEAEAEAEAEEEETVQPLASLSRHRMMATYTPGHSSNSDSREHTSRMLTYADAASGIAVTSSDDGNIHAWSLV